MFYGFDLGIIGGIFFFCRVYVILWRIWNGENEKNILFLVWYDYYWIWKI